MTYKTKIQALQEYTKVGVQSEIESASPHRLIQMLMDGALSRITKAKMSIKNDQVAEKGELISSAISIIGGLRDSLDHEAGGKMAENLESLYEYMTHRLLEANIKDDGSILTEVGNLLTEIKSAWDQVEQAEIQNVANASNG